ncbi:MAG: prepilin-type N-terminal cleavage/methylation domain-containing protein [Phycisphaerales bacterium]|nr:prepilin-type N-terminal cleavage/methylation domain-containing protein [Phycisphaerales bacterium]
MSSALVPRRPARGLSLVEVVISIAIVGGLLAASLSGVGALARARAISDERDTAALLAQELLAEVSARLYEDPDSAARVFGPETGETAGADRTLFDDVDDYEGLVESSVVRRGGGDPAHPGWSRRVEVRWAPTYSPDLDSGAETGLKRVTVTVLHGAKPVLSVSCLRAAARDSGVK